MKIDKDAELITEAYKKTFVKEEFEEQIEPSPREAAETVYGHDPEEVKDLEETVEKYLQEFAEKVATKLSQETDPFGTLVRSIKDFVRENGAEAPISKFIENV